MIKIITIVSIVLVLFSCKKETIQPVPELNETECKTYKVYSALISQNGTDNPTVIELENSIGNIVWTRSAYGLYNATLSNAFAENKTWIHSETGVISYVNYDVIRLKTYNLNSNPSDGELYNTPIEIRVYN